MSYDGWLQFGGVELVNLSRTAQLAEVLGIDTLWTDPESVAWIEASLAGANYDLIDEAPWYDPGFPASAEFAGIVPLSIAGLDDSTLESSTVEYITSGGSSGRARNKTLPIVANVAVVASTTRGAEFGKRWLDRTLKGGGARAFCSGSELRYFRYASDGSPQAHRRDVTLSRGTSVTRKRENHCSAVWLVTFTWTANDPFEYGDEVPLITSLGSDLTPTVIATGPGVVSSGGSYLTNQGCPVYDYTPVYDPLHPALVPAPSAPNFYPEGWMLPEGEAIRRDWARLAPVEPTGLAVVPVVTLRADVDARMVRVSIWPGDALPDESWCEPLWQGVVSYMPGGMDFVIDGEQEAAYVWDGASPNVRRTDSLLFGAEARPVQWTSFNDPSGLLVTLDRRIFEGYDGLGTIRAALSVVPKSD